MVVKFLSKDLQTICTYAEKTYPEECCGIILGELTSQGTTVVEVMPTENAWSAEIAADCSSDEIFFGKRRRYAISPQVMLQAQREARDRQLKIIGIYHSHIDHPAIPSECDRRFAWQEYSYIIVSVQNGKADDIKSWVLDDHHQFQEEAIENKI